jgi:hypothetical protein
MFLLKGFSGARGHLNLQLKITDRLIIFCEHAYNLNKVKFGGGITAYANKVNYFTLPGKQLH